MALTFNPITGSLDEVLPIKQNAFGASPNANGFVSDSQNNLTLEPADATHPGGVSTTTQSFGGNKTFTGSVSINGPTTLTSAQASGNVTVSGTTFTNGGIDTSAPGTLSIGGTNANIINIGNSTGTVNIQGTVITETTTVLNVTNPVINVNTGGGAGSGANSGVVVQENNIVTGYAETSSDRNSWTLKAPNTAGIATITPGASGITLNQSSHDPLTLSAVGASPSANGASLSSQVLTLQPADPTHPGLVSITTQTLAGDKTFSGNSVFNNNISAPGIFNPFGPAIDLTTGRMTDSSGVPKINWVSGTLTDASNNNQLSWSTTGVSFSQLTASTVPYLDASKTLTSSAVTPTQLSYLDATSSIQTQLNSKVTTVTGDLAPASFAASNNVASPANVTGLAFANGTTGSFEAVVQVLISATTPLRQTFKIQGTQLASTWDITQSTSGNESGYVFTITSAGQIQYQSPNSTGFTSATVRFRAITLPV